MGILNSIKNIFSSGGTAKTIDFSEIIEEVHKEFRLQQTHKWWEFKPAGTKAFNERLLGLSDKEKVAFIVTAVDNVSAFYSGRRGYSLDSEYQLNSIWDNLM